MSGIYQGKIGRLVLFAGASGAGKTSFLSSPPARMEESFATVPDFHELALDHRNLKKLKHSTKPGFPALCLHVDIAQPVRWLDPVPRSRDELLAAIDVVMFQRWPGLVGYVARAESLHIITLYVRREENFRRWMGRYLDCDPEGRFDRRVACLMGDATGNDEIHRKMYAAWDDFRAGIRGHTHEVLDGNGEKYSIMPEEAYRREVQG